MDDLKESGLALQPASGAPDGDEAFSRNVLFGLAIVIIAAVYVAYESLEAWAENLECKYHRGQLLAAYRRRRQWKKADIARLRSLGVNPVAQRRMERVTGRGRPVVNPRKLEEEIVEKLTAFQALTDPHATPAQRKKAIRQWPWWPHYVEALYRGEYALAKERKVKGASVEAEIEVGRALGISAAKVHGICGVIRRKRKQDPESANFLAITLAEYEAWLVSDEGFAQARLQEDVVPGPEGLTKPA